MTTPAHDATPPADAPSAPDITSAPDVTTARDTTAQDTAIGTTPRPQIRLLLGTVFLIYLGQMTLNPIIAPLSREVGLAEWQIGVTISTAAVMVVLTSQLWGRRSQSWGRKPVLVAAFCLALVPMVLFALLAWLGMAGLVTGTLLFGLFVLLRGVGFGAAIAAVPPTAQAYIADVTPDEAARVKGMAGVGAVQGVAMVAGSVLGGLLSVFGLITPLIAVPVLLGAGLVLIVFRLRRERRHELIETPARVSPLDPRVWPFLVAGFGMFTALGFIQVITGFIVQDRLGLDARTTGLVTGGALLAAGVGMILAQAVIVPRSGWTPPTLLRVGCVIALAGFLLLIPDAGVAPPFVALLFAAILLIGLGLGIAMPGYTAGPTSPWPSCSARPCHRCGASPSRWASGCWPTASASCCSSWRCDTWAPLARAPTSPLPRSSARSSRSPSASRSRFRCWSPPR